MDPAQIELLEMAYDEAEATLRAAKAAHDAAEEARDAARDAYNAAIRQPAWRYPEGGDK